MYDLLIIGAGAAGMTAALNALRSGKRVLVIERETIGGQIALSPKVENLPSIKAVSGNEFANNLFNQILEMGCEFEFDEVESIEKKDDIFYVKTKYNNYQAISVIIAAGVTHRHLNAPGEEDLIGKGVSYCAVCDGAFFKDEDIAIIGDANTAVQYALMLTNTSKTVHVCTLFDKFFSDRVLTERLLLKENVTVRHNISLQNYVTDENGYLKGLVFEDTQTKEIIKYDVKGCFIAIGQIPDNEKFKNLVDLDDKGYILVDESMQTKTKGLYAAGDCTSKKFRQVATAVADGAIAAFDATIYIESK